MAGSAAAVSEIIVHVLSIQQGHLYAHLLLERELYIWMDTSHLKGSLLLPVWAVAGQLMPVCCDTGP